MATIPGTPQPMQMHSNRVQCQLFGRHEWLVPRSMAKQGLYVVLRSGDRLPFWLGRRRYQEALHREDQAGLDADAAVGRFIGT